MRRSFAKGEGCRECFDSGFKGRTGIYEVLPVTADVRRMILELGETPHGGYLKVDMMKREIQKLQSELKGTLPTKKCPYCNQDGCSTGCLVCCYSGLVTAGAYDYEAEAERLEDSEDAN